MKSNTSSSVESCSQRAQATHPAGSRARVLLASVFGPYGQDDEYGSRRMNPMELYHNQVTRTQGAFSLRMFHRSWGLMMIQANIEAPCTLLDFPTLDRFIEEIRAHEYDIVGISSIIPNIYKVKKMCELIRQYLPKATIVVGGHIANVPDLGRRLDADHVVRGEGVRWFRRFLGENEERPLRHPLITSGLGTRNMGVCPKEHRGDVAATVIPSVGCPLGCNFCSTSAMFGGKGKSVNFYQTGDELYHIMCQLEGEMGVRSFFMMDENFLLHRKRALRLLELMEEQDKSWSLYVFSSANVLRSYTIEQLIRLGISWVWMGIEGCNSQYAKLTGIDTLQLVRELQSNGIRVLGSTIIGLENHTAENIDDAIEHAAPARHGLPPVHALHADPRHAAARRAFGQGPDEGRERVPLERHPRPVDPQLPSSRARTISRRPSVMVRAFERDFQRNGPSTVRIVRTTLAGWRRHKNHPHPCVRDRFAWEVRELATTFSAVVGAAKLYFRDNPLLYAKMSALLRELHAEFGWKSRLASAVGSRWVLRQIRQEEKRLAAGFSYEPPTFYERNEAATERPEVPLCRAASPLAPQAKPVAVPPPARKRNLAKV